MKPSILLIAVAAGMFAAGCSFRRAGSSDYDDAADDDSLYRPDDPRHHDNDHLHHTGPVIVRLSK
jgi:hypothetical protein